MGVDQLLKNYSYMLLEELEHTPKEKVGDTEFYNDELERIEQALKGKEKS